MAVTVLVNTPIWVCALLTLLLAFGWQQSKDWKVGRIRAFVAPAPFLMFSAFSVLSTLGVFELVAITAT